MQDASYAAHFLATARSSGATVHKMRERRAVAGRFRSAMAINDDHSAVIGGCAKHQFARDLVVVGDNGAGQTAFTQACQLDRFVD